MNVLQLCSMINLPEEVFAEIERYFSERVSVVDDCLKNQLCKRECWETALKELKRRIGTDQYGFCILAELLNIACDTYESYLKKGISIDIFIRTMEFCSRFIKRQKKHFGHYAFTWDWWFTRQIAMQEFRIEELEFELIDRPDREISIHIPSDADLRPFRLQSTLNAFKAFLSAYYPDWSEVDWYCESWLLSPLLNELLEANSNILYFKQLFELQSADMESMAVLDWVFPGETVTLQDLPETTSLQKKMKLFLLNGGKIGWVKGKYKKENNK